MLEFFDNVNIYYVEFVHVVQMLNQMDKDEVKTAIHHVLYFDQYQQKILSIYIFNKKNDFIREKKKEIYTFLN